MHFSQGDGEVSFCGAIEMSGFLELKYMLYPFFSHYCDMLKTLYTILMLHPIKSARREFDYTSQDIKMNRSSRLF